MGTRGFDVFWQVLSLWHPLLNLINAFPTLEQFQSGEVSRFFYGWVETKRGVKTPLRVFSVALTVTSVGSDLVDTHNAGSRHDIPG